MNTRILIFGALWVLAVGCDDAGPKGQLDEGVGDDAGTQICALTGAVIRDEVCDGRDNDCDRRVDEEFNTDIDVNHCGACNNRCNFGNGIAACRDGECAFGGCPPGTYDADGDHRNGCEGMCGETVEPEVCDGADNDCDGRTDETFDLGRDVTNCGACGNDCMFANAETRCDLGSCTLIRCDPGFGNLDGNDENGCESVCEPANPGPDRCDEEDNDCDGMVDEGFDLNADGGNCGACGVRCAYANATGACVAGTCELRACEAGFSNADGREENGCEQRCVVSNGGVEICDDIDNDCNGVVDDGFDKDTDLENCGGCGRVDEAFICRLPNAEVVCTDGDCLIDSCVPGFANADEENNNGCEIPCVVSNGGVEICDRMDNDCNGRADDGFDLFGDVQNCGACGTVCQAGNAQAACRAGRCEIGQCPAGFVDADQVPDNGCEYACVRTPNPLEVCDTVDNDCDGAIDEGFDIFSQLEHCGACDQRCNPANALALCNNGVCDIGGCDDGFVDANGDVEDGCENECTPSVDGFEVCDTLDNDCDDRIDEDFALATDPLNCGRCGNACRYPNGRVMCAAGVCGSAGCANGWFDANGVAADGCEYRCTPTADPTEICDNRDNNCNGTVDEGFDVSTDLANCGACGNACMMDNAVPACVAGGCRIGMCEPGFADVNDNPLDGCESNCIPQNGGLETCNAVDDDCDGRIDEDTDLSNDVENCGACGRECAVINGSPFCNGGQCRVLTCNQGFVDLDRDLANGCECPITNGGVEICDNLDNDCNGVVDDANRVVPPQDFTCLRRGVCQGVLAACRDARWVCPYPNTYELEESRCDGLDNDCDGQRDEPYPDLGAPCFDGVGACAGQGVIECNGLQAVRCTAAADPNASGAEVCNGTDDDCDGTVDENSDALVRVPAAAGRPAFDIYAYEASRTDAAGDTSGDNFDRACSKPGVLPWNTVDYATASMACASAGMRLCTAAEWARACEGPNGHVYPYGPGYDGNRCNGTDFDADAMTPGNQDAPIPTGSLNQCTREWAGSPVYDLSGNLWEWTSQDITGDGTARALRGGGYQQVEGGLTCQFVLAQPVAARRDNIGFRCCR